MPAKVKWILRQWEKGKGYSETEVHPSAKLVVQRGGTNVMDIFMDGNRLVIRVDGDLVVEPHTGNQIFVSTKARK